ncbi:uncharacterized protein LOC121524349 isoform X2 [Cheilinus undulatus]|uniref:uncharacterized protein LOC121524349 isoform X2 n=1 Tax=Cheilinus undulatus TaxID=241271 RepID=UPI001BD2F138|nr:uncharacterized protein LOC121524349 isoform X2 [Cheilinus undulatus]
MKRPPRPISKLLNPFTGGQGYNLAVALNFTQTKLEMPKTKQSSISTFFSPQRRVLNKMSTAEVLNLPVLPASSSKSSTHAIAASIPVSSGTKRSRETDHIFVSGPDHEQYETVSEAEAAVCPEPTQKLTPSKNVFPEFEKQFEEINPPLRKRRLISNTSLLEESQPCPQAWSQDPVLSFSQYTEDEVDLTYQKNEAENNISDSEPSFLNSLQSEDAFGAQMEGRTSTQKAFNSSQMDEKENRCILSSKSPRKQYTPSHIASLSNQKKTKPKTASPRKNFPSHLLKNTDKEESSDCQFNWTKPSVSPLKNRLPLQPCRPVDDDSLAMLFTQDSEGFRVIAHRGLKARSPLKDQSNRRTFKYVEEEDEEEDEMLFTQDSQGNMVIKH